MTLYSLPFHNKDLIEEKISMDSFVFCGKNWDFYFTQKVHKKAETLENCEISEKNIPEKIFDYDREQNLFLVKSC